MPSGRARPPTSRWSRLPSGPAGGDLFCQGVRSVHRHATCTPGGRTHGRAVRFLRRAGRRDFPGPLRRRYRWGNALAIGRDGWQPGQPSRRRARGPEDRARRAPKPAPRRLRYGLKESSPRHCDLRRPRQGQKVNHTSLEKSNHRGRTRTTNILRISAERPDPSAAASIEAGPTRAGSN